MKKTMIFFSILIVIVTTMFLIFILRNPPFVHLIEGYKANSDIKLTGNWWLTVYSAQDPAVLANNIPLPDIDFSKYNLVVSDGREIQSIKFTRSTAFPFRITHFGDVTFKEGLFLHTWFFYKIEKIELFPDPKFQIGE